MLWNDKTKGVNTNILNTTGIYHYFIFCLKGILSYKIEFTVYGNMRIRKTKMHGFFFFRKPFSWRNLQFSEQNTFYVTLGTSDSFSILWKWMAPFSSLDLLSRRKYFWGFFFQKPSIKKRKSQFYFCSETKGVTVKAYRTSLH